MLAADLGVNTAASRALARAYYEDPRALRRIAGVGLVAKLALTGAACAALLLGAGPIAAALGAGAALAPVIAWAAAQLLLDNLATFSFRALQGLHRDGALALAQAVSGVGSPLLSAAVVLLGYGAPGAVAGRAAGAGVAAVVAAAAAVAAMRAIEAGRARGGAGAGGRAGRGREAESRAEVARDLAGYASRILLVQLAYLVFFRIDQALVQLAHGTAALGLYQPAAAIAEKCLLPVVSVAAVLAPRFAAIDDPAARDRLAGLLRGALRSTALLYLPAAAGLAALGPEVAAAVFGDAFAATGPLLRAYGAALLVMAPATLLGGLLDYAGLARARALAFVAAAALDVALNLALLPRMGPAAAVLSLVFAMTPLVAFYLASLARRVGAPLRPLASDVGRAALAALAMTLALAAARPALLAALPLAAALPALVLLGATTYGAALLAAGGAGLLPGSVLRRVPRLARLARPGP